MVSPRVFEAIVTRVEPTACMPPRRSLLSTVPSLLSTTETPRLSAFVSLQFRTWKVFAFWIWTPSVPEMVWPAQSSSTAETFWMAMQSTLASRSAASV